MKPAQEEYCLSRDSSMVRPVTWAVKESWNLLGVVVTVLVLMAIMVEAVSLPIVDQEFRRSLP